MSELASQDLRDWVKGVEALGQLARLREIHWAALPQRIN